jgi:hypothetical protein
LKKVILILITTLYYSSVSGQNLYLKITGQTEKETKTIDSAGYSFKHSNTKSIIEENHLLTDKLTKKGYLEIQITESKKVNDSTFHYQYNIGEKTKNIHIFIGNLLDVEKNILFENKKDTIIFPFTESESLLNTTLKKLEANGFSMAKVRLINFQKKDNHITADLSIESEIKREVNDIVINGYDRFPEGHKKNIKRQFKNKVFNQQNLDKLYKSFEKYRFVKQTKYPEILFTKDSTKIYVYLEKTKSNSFDGFIGFTNDKNNKLIFSGYLDLILNNALNAGERFSLYWKSNGEEQKTFNIGIEVPYIFKSPLGIKTQLNIFKQDSTFQNTQTTIDLGFFFNYNTRLYLGYQSAESSDIQNTNTTSLSDFKNAFITSSFEFSDFKYDDPLFSEKSIINLKIGIGNRNSNFQNNKQFFGNILLKNNFYLNDKNILNIKSQNFYLQSNAFITNELYRFGGINSIRGFNENSLQGNIFSSLLTEYRYILTSSLYTHSIIDYGYFQDKTTKQEEQLLGLGFGFGLLTKNGLFNIVYANGSTKNQTIKLSNSIVHISFKTTF